MGWWRRLLNWLDIPRDEHLILHFRHGSESDRIKMNFLRVGDPAESLSDIG